MLFMVVIVLLLFFTMPLCKCCANMFVGGGCTNELEDIVVGMALEDPTVSIEIIKLIFIFTYRLSIYNI